MSDHVCVTDRLWDMQACVFIDGCYACLVPPNTLLKDVRYIHITLAQQRRMELAITKGYQVWSDGSDTLVWKDERLMPLFVVLTDEEWQGTQV